MIETLATAADGYAGVLLVLSLGSIVTVIVMMTVGARVVARMPSNYFIDDEARRHRRYLEMFPAPVRPVVDLIKNLLGLVFLLVGLILLLLPGPGLLTMLAGLLLMDFPGKFACERWLVRRRQVRRTIDWLREREGQPPLELD